MPLCSAKRSSRGLTTLKCVDASRPSMERTRVSRPSSQSAGMDGWGTFSVGRLLAGRQIPNRPRLPPRLSNRYHPAAPSKLSPGSLYRSTTPTWERKTAATRCSHSRSNVLSLSRRSPEPEAAGGTCRNRGGARPPGGGGRGGERGVARWPQASSVFPDNPWYDNAKQSIGHNPNTHTSAAFNAPDHD